MGLICVVVKIIIIYVKMSTETVNVFLSLREERYTMITITYTLLYYILHKHVKKQ